MHKPKLHNVYEHFKGGRYIALMIGKDAETQEECVIYLSLETGAAWTRKVTEWMEVVEWCGRRVPRFRLVEESEETLLKECRVYVSADVERLSGGSLG